MRTPKVQHEVATTIVSNIKQEEGRYEKEVFSEWRKTEKVKNANIGINLSERATVVKSSLWSYYSILKSTPIVNKK